MRKASAAAGHIQVALVTGASSGIGQAIASELCRHGFRVYAAARSLPDYFINSGCEKQVGTGCLRPVTLDVTDEAAVGAIWQQVMAVEGRLDCLVQAAGFGLAGSVEDTAAAEARAQMETNFFGSVHFLPLVLEQMRRQKSGLIVQLGSVAGFLPIPFQAYYSASKAALAALILALADEVRPWGIRCLLVQPGDTQTGFTRSRILARGSEGSDYSRRCGRSITKMAADENRGVPAAAVASQIVRQICKRRPPLVYTPGLLYKIANILTKILPLRLYRRVIGLMYAG